MTITSSTTLGELALELGKLGVQICQLGILPDGTRRCDLADASWARGVGNGATEAEAISNALDNLRGEIATLLAAAPKAVSLKR